MSRPEKVVTARLSDLGRRYAQLVDSAHQTAHIHPVFSWTTWEMAALDCEQAGRIAREIAERLKQVEP